MVEAARKQEAAARQQEAAARERAAQVAAQAAAERRGKEAAEARYLVITP